MKRTFTKIISIFFLICATLIRFEAFGDVTVVSGITLRLDESGQNAGYLREVIRQLDRYAAAADIDHSRQRITIVPSGNGQLYLRRNLLYLPGNAADWQEDFELRAKLYTFLIAHRFNLPYPGAEVKVFDWVVYGIDAELEAAATSGQHLVANREYFLLSDFAAAAGRLPDFIQMSRNGRSSDPVLQDFFSSQARILLTILAQNGKLRELFQRNFRGERPECFVDFYPSADNAADELNAAAERLIWNRYRPIPAAVALRKLAAMEKIFVQQLDENGELSGDFAELSWQEFSAQLALDRPDKAALRTNFAKRFSDLARLCGDTERIFCAKLADAARALDGSPENDAAFLHELQQLQAAFARRQAIERFLTDTMLVNTPLPDHFQRLFRAAKVDNRSCGEPEMRFLLLTINNYLSR